MGDAARTSKGGAVKVKIKRVGNHELPLPKYATPGDAGMDLRANILDHPDFRQYEDADGPGIWLSPGRNVSFDCGFAFAVPVGYELQVRCRSGLARQGIVVQGGVGTVDAPFRGAIGVTLHNMSSHAFRLRHGDRIAQAVIAPVVQAELEDVKDGELDATERGANGFGSSGMR